MEIRAFRGWRYRGDADGDISSFIAPPYDVLSARDKAGLLERSPNNIVAVDLPHVPPKEAGPDEAYRSAADLLNEWKSSGVLRRDDRPAVYAYEQTFRRAGRGYVRRAMLCGLRATELGRDVIPHEHTFAGPKADRLKLTEYTRMQLSPLMGFYSDPGGAAAKLLWAAASGEATCRATLGGVTEKLWAVTDADVISGITTSLRNVPAFIADGHHRYVTALNYRDSLLGAGRIDEEHPANFVMFALVAENDPGLLILPTHRIIRGLREDFAISRLVDRAAQFTWQRAGSGEAGAEDLAGRYGYGAIGFVAAGSDEMWVAKLRDSQAMLRAAPDAIDAWRELDVAVLHKLIIDEALEPWRTDSFTVEYTPDADAVLAECNTGRAQLGAYLQATPLAAVEAIARAGASMPHKSTYFYPKLATGMVLKSMQ